MYKFEYTFYSFRCSQNEEAITDSHGTVITRRVLRDTCRKGRTLSPLKNIHTLTGRKHMLRSVSSRICVTDTQRARAATWTEIAKYLHCIIHFEYLLRNHKNIYTRFYWYFSRKKCYGIFIGDTCNAKKQVYVRVKKNAYKSPFY